MGPGVRDLRPLPSPPSPEGGEGRGRRTRTPVAPDAGDPGMCTTWHTPVCRHVTIHQYSTDPFCPSGTDSRAHFEMKKKTGCPGGHKN